MKLMLRLLMLLICITQLTACYTMRRSKGGGQIKTVNERRINVEDIALPPGYKIEAVATGLTFPSGATVDEQGRLYVIETGYSYGEVWGEPKLLRVNADGSTTLVAKGNNNGPWSGIVYYKGFFYIAEGGETSGGKILRISPTGEIKTLIADLPSIGDHHTDGPIIKGNYIYFGQGAATNSGVVGPDNKEFGWLPRHPDFHDVPCKDINLVGQNYTSDNVLTPDPNDKATTGAYVPFGTPTTPGQVIKGRVPCNGAIMRIPLEGGSPELMAWGLRNPFGLALAADGRIFIAENGYDDRGSRPVWGAGDVLWELKENTWYGWPDFSGGIAMGGKKEFKGPGNDPVKPVLQNYPNTPPQPTAVFGVHSSANGMDFSSNPGFGHAGELFVAEFGDMAPKVGKVLAPVGFKVVRVNVTNGVIEDFAVNRGRKNGPASWDGNGGLERPLAVRFNPSGTEMYIVDFGIVKMTQQGPMPQKGTGVVWKVTKR